ncbi:MAG: GGDEF domain-containing protein [bacterium]
MSDDSVESKDDNSAVSWNVLFSDANTDYLGYTEETSFRENLLESYLRNLSVSVLKLTLLLVGLLVGLLWPVDYLLFDNPRYMDAFELWKPVVLLIIAVNIIGLHYLEFWHRNVFRLIVFSLCLAFGTIGYSFALLNEAGGPWFQILFMIPIATILLPVKPLPRLFGTLAIPSTYILGYLLVYPGHLDHPFALITMVVTGGLVLVSVLIGHVFYTLIRRNFFKDRRLRRRELEMKHLARHDQLTGLTNRRHFQKLLQEEFERARRYDEIFSVMMIDLDHFKDVNDTYGHQVGDAVLEELGTLIESDIRVSDFASRYGGEEFCVVLPETDLEGARKLADRLRKRLKDTVFVSNEDEEFTVTCSVGVSELSDEISDPETVITEADDALYHAKAEGRDTVMTIKDLEE